MLATESKEPTYGSTNLNNYDAIRDPKRKKEQNVMNKSSKCIEAKFAFCAVVMRSRNISTYLYIYVYTYYIYLKNCEYIYINMKLCMCFGIVEERAEVKTQKDETVEATCGHYFWLISCLFMLKADSDSVNCRSRCF